MKRLTMVIVDDDKSSKTKVKVIRLLVKLKLKINWVKTQWLRVRVSDETSEYWVSYLVNSDQVYLELTSNLVTTNF